MQKLEPRGLSLGAFLAAAALLAMTGSAAARSAGAPETPTPAQEPAQEQQQQQTREQAPEGPSTAPVRRSVPRVTGTVTRWTGNRIDLKTPDGKLQKVAVNEDTERLVEIKVGAEVTVEFRRRISGFVIAERVLAATEGAPGAQPGSGTTTGPKIQSVTGSVVSWSSAALLLRTDTGDLTIFVSPSTEYGVKSLDSGLQVTVEYREGSDGAKVATRVLAAKTKDEDSTETESGSE